MKRIKFIQSAAGSRLVKLRSIRSVRLQEVGGNGFKAARIIATLRGDDTPVTLAGYSAIEGTPEARNLPVQARADMDKLLSLLNGGRLRKGEEWPAKEV